MPAETRNGKWLRMTIPDMTEMDRRVLNYEE